MSIRILTLVIFLLKISGPDCSDQKEEKEKPTYPKLSEKVKKSQKLGGFLTFFREDGKLFVEIPKSFLKKEFFYFSTLSRGSFGGFFAPSLMLEQELFFFEKRGAKIGLMRRDLYHRAKEKSPMEEAVKKSYLPTLVFSFPIVAATEEENSYLIRLDDFFFNRGSNLLPKWILQFFGIKGVNPTLSHFTQVKVFPDNVEIEIQSTIHFEQNTWNTGQTNQYRMLFSLVRKKQSSYKTRLADDRIGYFTVDQKDFSDPTIESGERHFLTRWNLKKAASSIKSSMPKQPIVFYLDPTIPYEYRRFVRDGVLEWNHAFEKLGFIGALEVRQVNSGEPWDPLDVDYSTISWTANSSPWAIGPSRINPETGEILDADLIISSGWLSFLDDEASIFGSRLKREVSSVSNGFSNGPDHWFRRISNFVSAIKRDRFLPMNSKHEKGVVPRFSSCTQPLNLKIGRDFALLSAGAQSPLTGEAFIEWKKEFIGTFLKNLVMHEVGHALGLRHNFKASSAVSYEDLTDPQWSRVNQPSSSVMDYNDAVVSPDPSTQGKYINDSLGAYDFLAIEYGYSQFEEDQEKEKLGKVAASLRQKGLAYATDEDFWLGIDPLVEIDDFSDDPPKAARDRLAIMEEILQNLDGKLIKEGDRYDHVKRILFRVLNEHLFKTLHIMRLIGGISSHRDHVNDPASKLSYLPISRQMQEDALSYLRDRVFSEDWLKFPKKITSIARWDPWQFGSGPPISMDWIHRFFQILSLFIVMDGENLKRIQSFHEKVDPEAIKSVEILQKFYDFVFQPWWEKKKLSDPMVASYMIQFMGIWLQDDDLAPRQVKNKAIGLLDSLKIRLEEKLKKQQGSSPGFQIHKSEELDFSGSEERTLARRLLSKIRQVRMRKRIKP